MIVAHVILVLRRLRDAHSQTGKLAQALFDLMLADMDQDLREMGVGDLAVGKRVKGMAMAFYGRLAAYGAALRDDDAAALQAALSRNLYRERYRRSPKSPPWQPTCVARPQASTASRSSLLWLVACASAWRHFLSEAPNDRTPFRVSPPHRNA